MNIVDRKEETITFHHLDHIYQVQVADCEYAKAPDGKAVPQFLSTPEMLCIREQCPECAKAAEERGIPGYRTPAQTCFPLMGDAEAMEMHLRHRVEKGGNLEAVFTELEGQMLDIVARERLRQAKDTILGEVDPYPFWPPESDHQQS